MNNFFSNQFDTMDEDVLRQREEIYGGPEARKQMRMSEETL